MLAEMLLKPFSACGTSETGFDDDKPAPSTLMAKTGEHAIFLVEPYAHGTERIAQIGLLNRYLDGHAKFRLCPGR